MIITKIFTFDSAHLLLEYEGKCSNLHGHTYKLEVSFTGELNNGMIKDFGDIKDIVNKKIINKLDHRNLNDVLPFRTTAENISMWCLDQLKEDGAIKVKLWETPTSYVEVYHAKMYK